MENLIVKVGFSNILAINVSCYDNAEKFPIFDK